ncbi:unnamed protein product [Haemonchus placei]|uniref:Uncharacterized protein n=1 Tax=Haemonchus placei TaxID=6290 RepID=A0A3P7XJB1_HAEPC|nr:unnamed protein product [Haemonchus placei]
MRCSRALTIFRSSSSILFELTRLCLMRRNFCPTSFFAFSIMTFVSHPRLQEVRAIMKSI